MAGHKISSQDRTYWLANPEDLKQHYIKALPYLSIDKAKIRDVESLEFKTIIEDSEKKDKRIEKLEKKVELMEERDRKKERLFDNEEFTKKHL